MLLAPGRADAGVPGDFYGVVSQGALRSGDHELMAQGGVAVLRFPVEWAQVEAAPGDYDWSRIDAIVQGAVANGIAPLPFVWATPSWVDPQKSRPPLDGAVEKRAWQGFLAALAGRYGSVVDRWQIWNEGNFKHYWKPEPSPRDYAELLRLSSKALRAADPGAEILTGGVAPVKRGMLPWKFLERLYRVPGVERWFDTVAVHPYSPELFGVEFQISQALDEIEAAGDRSAGIRVTELGWASDGPAEDPMNKGPAGQAKMLQKSYRLLVRKRRDWRIEGIDWHSFQDVSPDEGSPTCSFCPGSGLVTAGREPKPAWNTFMSFAGR
jgi:hypothetical protein